MAELVSIARPYARAAFEYADGHNALPRWQDMLSSMAFVANDASVGALLSNPKVTNEQLNELFLGVLAPCLDGSGGNFIRIVAERGRLAALPQIHALFQQLVEDKQKSVTAKVFTAHPLSQEQQQSIKNALEVRLAQQVELDTIIDPTVYGGVRVEAKDLVIDGSVRGRLQRLFENLNA